MRALMFLFVLVLFCYPVKTSKNLAVVSANSVCCNKFTIAKIPLKRIVSYHWTTTCLKAIVFKTVSGKEICVDPESTFVSKQVKTLDNRTKV